MNGPIERAGSILIAVLVSQSLTAQSGPAGIGSNTNNVLWLRADQGVYADAGTVPAVNGGNVQQWNDRSGNGKHALQATVAKRPDLITNLVNGLPALRFKQANSDHFITAGLSTGDQASVWVVARYSSLPSPNPGLLQGGTTGNALASDPSQKNIGMWVGNANSQVWGRGIQADGASRNVPATTTLNANTWYVLNANYDGTNIVQYVNNAAAGTIAYNGTLRSWTDVAIGVQAGNENWNGDIAEVIMFNTSLNMAQRVILGNHLAAKYGTTLGAADIYTGDDAANGDFDHEVAGIGRTTSGNLQQDSQGTGVVRISGPTDLNNDEFLLWGHNGGGLGTFGVGDRPAGVQGRWQRAWYVNEVNSAGGAVDVGAVDITFDLNGLGPVDANDLRLLVDTDNDKHFANNTPISGATDLGGGLYRFAGITALSNGNRFTLGTANSTSTPLPIELVAFTAMPVGASDVRLEWTTASEQDNDHFTVERSADLDSWEAVATVAGAGTSSSMLHYAAEDTDAPLGDVYYRLRQTDIDGTSTLSAIQHVRLAPAGANEVQVYPNPTEGSVRLHFLHATAALARITLLDPVGRTVLDRTWPSGAGDVPVDLAGLPSGTYLLQVQRDERVDVLPVVRW